MPSAPEVTEKIYRLLAERIDPQHRRKLIEEVVHRALEQTRQGFESRVSALEEVAHTPFDFTDLISRLERCERRLSEMAEAQAR